MSRTIFTNIPHPPPRRYTSFDEITKHATHEDLGFYAYLGQTGRNERR